MIRVIAKQYVDERKMDAYLAVVKELIEKTRAMDKGCISYTLCQDIKKANIMTFIEEWESMEALNNHMQTEHFKTLGAKLSDFYEARTELNIYKEYI
ncbi:antibiotic biosynthesis monooxygenase [Fusibacter paucivorans]|uniref:Antibiotic biosynthesis monooxygenase n=1 Tax=Fusibacter paucivorans TaxID=76009 RepID=A0ABS5PP31_9FIRM|nr:putative quinol monooxygenase [Fusibacter paucivorans]MBS7526144.1 antibiotic biosynthesis monooxygenase [Fusibacter paucivorans]